MILVTGPTGSGKTTTLYAMLHAPRRRPANAVNISTIEDPIEYTMPRVNQIPVNTSAGLDFAGGLRALLRQDPDVIMVGEIRDRETADIGVRAALVGRLFLSTPAHQRRDRVGRRACSTWASSRSSSPPRSCS